ncbi:MAG: AAA family ATPase [Acidobacteriota bacterium]
MRTIAFGSGSSGTGKTFIATHLAACLARQGVRTCVVDLNLDASDLHLAFGLLDPKFRLLDFFDHRCESLESAMIPVPNRPRLWLIPGSDETVRANALRSEEIERLMTALRDLPVDLALLDLAPGIGQTLLDLFLAADLPLVVCNSEQDSLKDAARFVRLARLRSGAHGPAGTRGKQRLKVYTNLDDLVRDMNAIREEQKGGSGRFRPSLVLNRGAEPTDQQRRHWRRELDLDIPFLAAVPNAATRNPGSATDQPPIDLDANDQAAEALEVLAATLWAELATAAQAGAEEEVALASVEPLLR